MSKYLHRHVVYIDRDRLSCWSDGSDITLSSRGLWTLKLEGHYCEGGSFSGVAPVEALKFGAHSCGFVRVISDGKSRA